MKQPKFSVSIIAFNKLELTKRCIESVLKHSKNYELILTDNASTDGTYEYFKTIPGARVIRNKSNLGFSGPNNYALERAKGKYFVTLNNDCEVPAGWLSYLEEPFKHYMTAAISGPAGSCCSFLGQYPSFHGSPGREYEYVEGSCLCIPTKLARKHTLFAPYLHFAYAEDVDLSLRMRARGHTIHQVPFNIIHHRSATSKEVPGIREIQQRNHRALIDRWGNYLFYRKFDLPVIIRRQAALGDVLLVSPLIRALKEQQPKSEIYVETQCPDVLAGVAFSGGPFPHTYKWARIIELDMSYENMPNTHIAEAYFKRALIIPEDDMRPDVVTSDESDAFANTAMPGDTWVAVHVGPSTWPGKQWPMRRFQALCQWLLDKQLKVVLVGTPGPGMPNYLDLRGLTNSQQLASVLGKCKLFIGLDSYPIHVAQAMGVPVLGLFGATDPQYILAKGEPHYSLMGTAECAGQRHRETGKTFIPCDGACINSISLEDVKKSIPL